ncbi:PD-(D/E)XK nuclease family protein [Haloglomus halophilum]|uniref:PD-(D/E)XK nuclease family protein n=1 Tax=Haloglomus halophilum TaxID=2962672 RepID=UPI0020C98F99|nr:PD-(D/E)XK nuclease family protein [Haloglomus halophilum]
MTLREAASIDDLHRAIRDTDLALTSDPPLALALDRRVDRPRIGRVGATPRGHASNQLTPMDRRNLFRTLITETDLTWKQAHRALDRTLQAWDRTGNIDAILDHDEFDTPAMRTAVETLRTADSSYHKLANSRLDDEVDLAVIGESSLSELDRSLLPADYETVDRFTGATGTLPTFDIFPSATAIVDALIEQLSADTAESVGVVLDESTVFSPLVEAGLAAAEIPFQGGPGFVDDPDVRTFLRLLQAVFTGSDLRVGDIEPLLAPLGVDVPRKLGEQRVDALEDSTLPELATIEEAVHTGTLRDAIRAYEALAGVTLGTLRDECDRLDVLDTAVTSDLLDRLTYYVQSFDVPVDRERDGVLLTDAASTAYIDRPVVFYLGLGAGWAKTPPDVPWIDSTEYVQQDLDRFEILLQNGRQRHYLVQDTRAGEDVTPCVYFRQLFEQSFDRFSDLPHERYDDYGVERGAPGQPFVAPPGADGETEEVDALSQSTLKRLANCPREEFFTRLVETPTASYMARGTVVHEAAELYVTHPETVREEFETVVDAMVEQVRAYATDDRHPVERTQLAIALETAMEYLDANPPVEADHEAYADRSQENELADRLDLDCASQLTERWFEAPEAGIRGFVDLLRSPTDLVDYKTGSQSTASKLRDRASIDPLHDDPNFQVALYLLQHRRQEPDEPLSIHFVHVLEHADRMARGEAPDIGELVTTITYLPVTFSEFVARREVYEAVTDYADSNDRVKALDPLGYDAYREFFLDHDLPREGEAPEQREAVITAFIEYTKRHVKDTAYVENGCRDAINDMDDVVGTYYLKPDLDAFETFVDEQLANLNEYRNDSFPVRAIEDGPNWDRVDTRDLILTDD